MAWQEHALCTQVDTDLFFPEKDQSSSQACGVCRACPVIDDCLQYALDHRELYGVWGGKSARQRQTLLTELRRTTQPRKAAA